VLPFVLNLGDARRVVRNVLLLVPLDRVISPRAVPQAVDDIHILVGNLVALIMWHQILAKGVGSSLRPAGDNIPGDATLGEVVEGAEGPGEGKGRDVAGAARDAKGDGLCDGLAGARN
jgi:hypothetical protein